MKQTDQRSPPYRIRRNNQIDMNQTFIINQHRPRLVLFFAGWGMDETPFLDYCPQDSDLMICYDYRRLDFDVKALASYREIHLISWSMGVWAASQVMRQTQPLAGNVVRSTAINGTPYPVDAERGIPPTVFEGTLHGLCEASLLKFQRRMCADGEAFRHFQTIAPHRLWEELKEELAAIGGQCQSLPASDFVWNRAIIGDNDRIFPPQAQHHAWQAHCLSINHVDAAHYDFDLLQQYITK